MGKLKFWSYERIPWIYALLTLPLVFYINIHFAEQGIMRVVSSTQQDFWFGMFMILVDGIFFPLQYWSSLLFLFYTIYLRFLQPTVLLRYNSKLKWFRALFIQNIIWSVLFIFCFLLIAFFVSAIHFGVPSSWSWKGTALSKFTPLTVIGISVLARLSLAIFIGFLFILLAAWKNAVFSYITVFTYTTLAGLVLISTPPYISFKPFIFTASINISFFLTDNFLSNISIAIFTPLVLTSCAVFALPILAKNIFIHD